MGASVLTLIMSSAMLKCVVITADLVGKKLLHEHIIAVDFLEPLLSIAHTTDPEQAQLFLTDRRSVSQ